jgi:UDP-glucuronate decarboxylase
MMNVANFRGPVNLGNPGEFTILSLAEKVIKMATSPSKLVFRDLPSDDPVRRKPDIGLAKEKLGWAPTIDIDAGLVRTIEYFKQTLDRG